MSHTEQLDRAQRDLAELHKVLDLKNEEIERLRAEVERLRPYAEVELNDAATLSQPETR